MVGSTPIEDCIDKNGNPLRNFDSAQAEMLSRNTNHCQFTKFENSTTIGAYACDRNIVVKTVTITKENSVCETDIEDITKTKIASYDTLFGIDFDSYTKGRQYLIVVDYTGTADASLPADAAAYSATDKVVIFSGYNKKGSAINHNEMRYHMDWVGVENLLDEIIISGCYIKNVVTPKWPGTSESLGTLKVLSNQKCIFNEGGRGDRMTEMSSAEMNPVAPIGIHYYFNKSGIKHSGTWTLEQILRYVVENYCKSSSELIALDNRLGLKLISYISNYIDFDYSRISSSDFANIVPYDFSIEGLGVYEAIKKIINESKKYTLYKAYTSDGKVTLTYKIKNVDATIRGTDDFPMLLRIGVQDAVPDSTIVLNSADINLNREMKNVGRVIVMGDYLCLNTLMTTCAYTEYSADAAFSGNFSTNLDTYSAIAGLTTFSDRVALAITDTTYSEVYEQTYLAVPINMLTLTISGLTADLNTYHTAGTDLNGVSNQEAESTLVFNTMKACKINRFISRGTITEQGQDKQDVAVYAGFPFERVASGDSTTYFNPTNVESGTTFYYISPLNADGMIMDAKIYESDDKKERSALIISEKMGGIESLTENAQTPFYEYQYKSTLEYFDISKTFTNYSSTKPIPLFVRANIQTDYRIKGISSIANFDRDVHQTLIVYDDDFKLSLNYKDALYNGAGSFSNITNGYINASDSAILQKLQEKSDALLDKYSVVQNSGTSELNGVQYHWKVGDWSDKFLGTGRSIETPVIVDRIVFGFQQKKTNLFFGNR